MNKLSAIITGVAGQDGSYLAEYLLDLDYFVIGVSRRKSVEPGIKHIEHLMDKPCFVFIEGDITDPTFISSILHKYHPHEFYNLAAQSHVGQSFKEPVETFRVNAMAVIMQLEMIRQITPFTKYYFAATSELFGGLNCPETGYTELSEHYPRSPYAVAKEAAYRAVINYREAYSIYACSGILFNHSSPRRGLDFATRKITHQMAKVRLGLQDKIKMGNLDAYRDEGHSKDYCKAMHLMLQQERPEEFIISTGETTSIREMFEYVANLAGYTLDEVYEKDERFMRPSDVQYLLGDSSRARMVLNWKPEYDCKKLLKEMYENDLKLLKDE